MQNNMMGQNIIITERCQSLRQLGRNALRGKWGQAILAMVIYTLVLNVPTAIFDNLFGVNMANLFTNEGFTYDMDVEMYSQLYNSMPQTSILSSIWMILITGALTLGLMIFFLAAFRGHNVVGKDVFLGFERFGKALGLLLYQALFIFLWSMLFIIPGIIASIRYSQAFFVLADDPNKSITQCMDESKFMMKGNKAKYFLLGLSFIGWLVLSVLPGSILDAIAGTMTDSKAVIAVVSVISSLLLCPVYAYMYSTFAGFYEILAGHLIKETAPAPLSVDQIEVNASADKIAEVIDKVENNAPAAQPEAAEEAAAEDITPEAPAQGEALPEPLEEEDKYND